MVARIEKRDFRDFDWLTTLLAITIAGFGIWQIHNALPSEGYWSKQIVGLGIAIVAFLVVAFNDYRRIIDAAPVFYGGGLFLLLLVLSPLGDEGPICRIGGNCGGYIHSVRMDDRCENRQDKALSTGTNQRDYRPRQ